MYGKCHSQRVKTLRKPSVTGVVKMAQKSKEFVAAWRGFRNGLTVDPKAKIKVLVGENPKSKKPGERFAVLRNGMTVKTALDKGYTKGDLAWDVMKGYISVTGVSKPTAQKKAKKAA